MQRSNADAIARLGRRRGRNAGRGRHRRRSARARRRDAAVRALALSAALCRQCLWRRRSGRNADCPTSARAEFDEPRSPPRVRLPAGAPRPPARHRAHRREPVGAAARRDRLPVPLPHRRGGGADRAGGRPAPAHARGMERAARGRGGSSSRPVPMAPTSSTTAPMRRFASWPSAPMGCPRSPSTPTRTRSASASASRVAAACARSSAPATPSTTTSASSRPRTQLVIDSASAVPACARAAESVI